MCASVSVPTLGRGHSLGQGEYMPTEEYWGTILLDDDGQPRVYVASNRGPLLGRNLGIGPFWSPSEAEYATVFVWNVATRLVDRRRRWCLAGWERARQRYGDCFRDW